MVREYNMIFLILLYNLIYFCYHRFFYIVITTFVIGVTVAIITNRTILVCPIMHASFTNGHLHYNYQSYHTIS